MYFLRLSVILLVLLCAYIYVAHAYIYYRIGAGDLPFPETEHSYTLKGEGTPRVYAALGDSLTASVGTSNYKESYPYLLAEKLRGENALTLRVFAFPGITSSGLIANYLPAALESNPTLVSVMIGTNDIHNWVTAEEFEENYRTILERLTTHTEATVYALSIPYIGSRALYLPPLNFYYDYKVAEFNAVIARLATEYGVQYVDIAEPTKRLFKTDGDLYAADSFHPSALGYRLWADLLYDAFNR